MQQGILNQVKDDYILIDAKWYKVQDPKYVPREMGIGVQFETAQEDAGLVKFIKRSEPKAAGSGSSYQKKSYSGSSSAGSTNRDRSIVRQVIFKAAVELVSSGKYPSVDAAMEDLKKNEDYMMAS
jgi:hypothetical protein